MKETDGEGHWSFADGDDILFDFLSKSRALLLKSCTLEAKAVKKIDMEVLLKIYADKGIVRSDKQIRKTINNLRSRVRLKIDRSRTENKPIKLSLHEQKFLDLEPVTNPPVARLAFGCSVGLPKVHPCHEAPANNLPPPFLLPSTPDSPPALLSVMEQHDTPSPAPSGASSASSEGSEKIKSVLGMQKDVLEMQLKAANEQYLAARQQRIYYEQKNKRLEVLREIGQATDTDVNPTNQVGLSTCQPSSSIFLAKRCRRCDDGLDDFKEDAPYEMPAFQVVATAEYSVTSSGSFGTPSAADQRP